MGATRQHDKTLPTGIYRVRGRFQIQWMDNGKRQRELLKPGTSLDRAIRRRGKKLDEVEEGTPTMSASSRVTFDKLMEARSTGLGNVHKSARGHPQLHKYFTGRKAATITYSVLEEYVRHRQEQGAADATVHNELAALRNGFRRGRKGGLIGTVPEFPMPHVQNVRESYFTVEELDGLLKVLPAYLRAPVQFAALTGMRAGNVFGLTWEYVDFGAGEVRVPFGMTKTGEPLTFPFAHGSPLEKLLRTQERAAKGVCVFHHRGRKISSYHGAWRTAMRAMGEAGYGTQFDPHTGTTKRVLKRFHDLRHTFAQHATEAGMAEATLLDLGGWKTPAMLRRYRIVNQDAKRKAVEQRDAHVAAERKKPKVIDLMKQLRVAGGRR